MSGEKKLLSGLPLANDKTNSFFIHWEDNREFPLDGVMISWNVLDSVAKYAGLHNANPILTLSPIFSKGSTRKISKEEAIGLPSLETKFGVLPRLSGKASSEVYNNTNVMRANSGLPGYAILNNYHWYNSTDRRVNPLLDAYRYYALGDYNRGDKDHTSDVRATGKRLFLKPLVLTWWNLAGRYFFTGTLDLRPDWVKRLEDPTSPAIEDWEHDGNVATHKLAYKKIGDKDILFPMILNINGELLDFTNPKVSGDLGNAYESAVLRGDTLEVPEGLGQIVSDNYKQIYNVENRPLLVKNILLKIKSWFRGYKHGGRMVNYLEFFKDGGKSPIHIKKSHEGQFTKYCHGKVTEECIARGKRSSSAKIRKQATFAANARKWKH